MIQMGQQHVQGEGGWRVSPHNDCDGTSAANLTIHPEVRTVTSEQNSVAMGYLH